MSHRKRLVLLLVIAVLLFCALALLHNSAPSDRPDSSSSQDTSLTEAESYLPSGLMLGEKLPYTKFSTLEGGLIDLNNEKGAPLVLLFWSGFCPHCKEQLALWEDAAHILDAYGARLLLLARTGGDRETLSSAALYAEENAVPWPILYDENRTAYDAWGVRRIPTTVIVDGDGVIRAIRAEKLSAAELEALLQDALLGRSVATEAFLLRTMREDGGIPTIFLERSAAKAAVISESQGLAMECALLSGNRTMFDQAYSFVNANLRLDSGLYAWRFTAEGDAATANALLDDLRIYHALTRANALWGGYEDDAKALHKALLEQLVQKGSLVDFYDAKSDTASTQLSLHYADFEAIRLLDPSLSARMLSLVEGGYISDQFPLYFRTYDYRKKRYLDDDLHTAEALYTVWHLAQAGKVRTETIIWLHTELARGGPMALYRTNGTVPSGYTYTSSAVYALVGLIADEIGDTVLLSHALQLLDQIRITDADSSDYGAFGEHSGSFHAFDQALPLLLYRMLEQDADIE